MSIGQPQSALKEERTAPSDASTSRMGRAPIPQLLREFAVPAMVGIVVQTLYNIIDSIYVGHGVGDLGLAAVTVSLPLFMLFIGVGLLFGGGANALAAIKLGQGKHQEADYILTYALILMVVSSAAIASLSNAFLPQLLVACGATPAVMPYATEFLKPILLGSVVMITASGLNNLIRTAGSPRMALITIVVGVVVNIVLGYLFVIRLHWGMSGAAYATLIANAIASIMSILFFCQRSAGLRLVLRGLQINPHLIMRILALGVAPAVLELGYSAIQILQNQLIIWYATGDPLTSEEALIIYGIVGRIAALLIVPSIGVAIGMQPIIGFNYGAKQYGRVCEAVRYATQFAFFITLPLYLAMMIWPEVFAAIFNLNRSLIQESNYAIRLSMGLMVLLPLNVIGGTLFEALGQATKATLMTMARQFFLLMPIMVLSPMLIPRFFNVEPIHAVWLSWFIADVVALVVVQAFARMELRRLSRLRDGLDDRKYLKNLR